MSTNPQEGSQPTVVLVHGGFVDGSGWQGVYNQLKDTYNVRVIQNPTMSLEGDVAATKMITTRRANRSFSLAIPMAERWSPRRVMIPREQRSSILRPWLC